MRYAILFEKIPEEEGMKGFYYAHIPSLDLTTHGKGISGARDAAIDLVQLWLAEKNDQQKEKTK